MEEVELERLVSAAYRDRDRLREESVRDAVETTIAMLDRGAVIQFTGKTNLTLLPRPKDAE